MDEKTFQDALRGGAARHIPEVDLWGRIKPRVASAPRDRRLLVRFAVAGLVVAVVLMTTMVGYALVRMLDPGTQHVIDEGLAQPVGQSQTLIVPTSAPTPTTTPAAPPTPTGTAVPGQVVEASETLDAISVTIRWAYADANRVLIGFESHAPSEMFATPYQGIIPQLTYRDGRFFNHSITPLIDEQTDTSVSGVLSLGHNEPPPADGVYHLNLTMLVTEFISETPLPENPTREDFARVSGQTVPVGELVFPLDLAVAPERVIEVDEAVTVDGVTVRLEAVSITPAAANVTFCYEFPSTDTQDWMARTTLAIDGQEGLPLGGGIVGGKGMTQPGATERCWEESFSLGVADDAQRLTFTVRRIISPPAEGNAAERFEQASEALAAEGIVVEFEALERGWTYEVIAAPDDMLDSDVGMRVFEALAVGLDGPWVFDVPLR